MIWTTYRQFRVSAVVALVGLAAAAAVLVPTGLDLARLYDNSGIATCQANGGDCGLAIDGFLSNYSRLRPFTLVVPMVPGLIGLFWGAPLVARELEAGTHRLAWTQSVTRTRWLLWKLVLVGLAAVIVAGLVSLMFTWWFSPVDHVNANRFDRDIFSERGIVPMGYAAFAFALGVTAGAVIRRTLPAMAVTLVVFVAVLLSVVFWVRPHLMTPEHDASSLDPMSTGYGSSGSAPPTLHAKSGPIPDAWILSTDIVDGSGNSLTPQVVKDECPDLGIGPRLSVQSPVKGPVPSGGRQALADCVARVGATYHAVVTYQPASRYWAFQGLEMGMFLGLAALLSGFSVWWVRARLV